MKIYQGAIHYGEYSAYIFSDSSLEKVSKTMVDGLAFYKGNGNEIKKVTIEALCDKCFNTGTYRKPTQRRFIGKVVECDCNKRFEAERYIVTY